MAAMGQAILDLRAAGSPDGFLYSDEALFEKDIRRPSPPTSSPTTPPTTCCAATTSAIWRVPAGAVPAAGGRAERVRRQPGPRPVPPPSRSGGGRGPSAPGAVLLAGARRVHLRRGGRQALCGRGGQAGHCGPSGPHRPERHGGGRPVPQHLPGEVGDRGRAQSQCPDPQQGPCGRLEKCLHSLYARTLWERYEVVVIENNSEQPETFAYYKQALQRYDGLRVVRYPGKGFNFSAINNFGGNTPRPIPAAAEQRCGGHRRGLDDRAAAPVRPAGGGAVAGAMLYYPDDTIQHAGVITGLGGYAGHSHKYKSGAAAAICSGPPPCRTSRR